VAGAPRVVARDWELWLSLVNRWADGLHEAGLTLTADVQVPPQSRSRTRSEAARIAGPRAEAARSAGPRAQKRWLV
jgi:hypothetical protein